MNKLLILFVLLYLFSNQTNAFLKHKFNKSSEGSKTMAKDGYPIIGILDSPLTRFFKHKDYTKKDTMIPSSYVKLIESTGAHTIRIPFYASYEKLDEYLKNINGLLLTGGSQLVRVEKTQEISVYGKKVKYLLEKILEMNEQGVNFPVYGICNGFSQIVCSISSKDSNICNVLTHKKHVVEKKRIEFTQPLAEPFHSMKNYLTDVLQIEDQLLFYHSLYLEKNNFEKNKDLQDNFYISSMSENGEKLQFISSIHHKKYPIFADVFHPEKSLYEWKNKTVSHQKESILFGYYIAKYFTDQAKKNNHVASDEFREYFIEKEEQNYLIETPTLSYESIYVYKYDSSLVEKQQNSK